MSIITKSKFIYVGIALRWRLRVLKCCVDITFFGTAAAFGVLGSYVALPKIFTPVDQRPYARHPGTFGPPPLSLLRYATGRNNVLPHIFIVNF